MACMQIIDYPAWRKARRAYRRGAAMATIMVLIGFVGICFQDFWALMGGVLAVALGSLWLSGVSRRRDNLEMWERLLK